MQYYCGNCKHCIPTDNYFKCDQYDTWVESNADASNCTKWESNGEASGGCFITSACVKHKGLPDDGELMTSIRAIRDEYIRTRPYGEHLIQRYYDDAPSIVEQIDSHSDKDEIYEEIYKWIMEIVAYAGRNDYETAVVMYMMMVYDLRVRLLTEL